MSDAPLLEVEDLHVWFDLEGGGELHAVQGVSFGLEPGERMGLVGGALEDALNPRLRVAHLSARTFRLRPLVGRGKDAL